MQKVGPSSLLVRFSDSRRRQENRQWGEMAYLLSSLVPSTLPTVVSTGPSSLPKGVAWRDSFRPLPCGPRPMGACLAWVKYGLKLPRSRSTPSWPTCSLLAMPRPSLEAKPPIPRCRLSATARPQRESWGRIYTPSVPLPGTPPYIGGWEGYDSQRIANPSLPWPGACLIEESISALGTRGEATPPVLY
jgi:hypothetical protein